MPGLNDLESYMAGRVFPKVYEALFRKFGVEFKVQRRIVAEGHSPEESDAAFDFYQGFSGLVPNTVEGQYEGITENQEFYSSGLIIFQRNDFVNLGVSVPIEENSLVTIEPLLVGDIIYLVREDFRAQGFQLYREEGIGTTQAVYRVFKLSAIGD